MGTDWDEDVRVAIAALALGRGSVMGADVPYLVRDAVDVANRVESARSDREKANFGKTLLHRSIGDDCIVGSEWAYKGGTLLRNTSSVRAGQELRAEYVRGLARALEIVKVIAPADGRLLHELQVEIANAERS